MFDLTNDTASVFQASAGEAAKLLRALGNERRLMILCQLGDRELPAGALQEPLGLSQSALYYGATQVPDAEAQAVYRWLVKKGMKFHYGTDEATELTEAQVLWQCKTYVAALRIADEFGCESIGIQYQQGLKDLLPASDLVEGILNNSDRPPVKNAAGQVIRAGQPLTHFNEVDECAGLDGLFTNRVHAALGQPVVMDNRAGAQGIVGMNGNAGCGGLKARLSR